MADALDLIKERVKLANKQALALAESVTAEQLAWRPTPKAHSIAWTLWHIARSADRMSVELAAPGANRTEVWVGDGLAKRWRLGPEVIGSNSVGTDVSDDVAATIAPPARDDLLGYARRAFAAVESSVAALTDADLGREYESAVLERHETVGNTLLICLTHTNRHLGELEYLKGLQGMKGTVTR
jgi:uncharacterized damage-inducible protein DinB